MRRWNSARQNTQMQKDIYSLYFFFILGLGEWHIKKIAFVGGPEIDSEKINDRISELAKCSLYIYIYNFGEIYLHG